MKKKKRKLYLHNWRTLEDLEIKPPRGHQAASLSPTSASQNDLQKTLTLRSIWYFLTRFSTYGLRFREACSAKPLQHSQLSRKDSQRMFLFQRFFTNDGCWLESSLGKQRASPFDCHTHLGQFYIYIYVYIDIYINHCGSRANLGLHVNWWKKLFFVCLSLLMKHILSLGPTL